MAVMLRLIYNIMLLQVRAAAVPLPLGGAGDQRPALPALHPLLPHPPHPARLHRPPGGQYSAVQYSTVQYSIVQY